MFREYPEEVSFAAFGYSGRKHDLLSKFIPLDYPWGEDGYLSVEGDKSHLSLEGNGAS